MTSWDIAISGFPRTVAQGQALYDKDPVDLVISLNIPFEVIIDRIKGRWVHIGSGRVYHNEFNPPKVPVSLCHVHILVVDPDPPGNPSVSNFDMFCIILFCFVF